MKRSLELLLCLSLLLPVFALAEEEEDVAFRQLDARTGTRGCAGIGTRAGNGLPGGDEKMHRAQDGQAAAATVAVGETQVTRGVI